MSKTENQAAPEKKSRPYVNPYLAGVLLGLVLFTSFFLTGNGLGASGGIQRLLVSAQDVVAPEHVDRIPYLIAIARGAKHPLDHWVVMVTIGTIIGGFLSGLLNGRLKVETNKGPRISTRGRWAMALVGGVIMGYGARLARGCTSGQALSGGAVLSAGSWALMFAIFAGGYALAWFLRRAWT
jgi:uncharacterized membrane protein YedE/YeeE